MNYMSGKDNQLVPAVDILGTPVASITWDQAIALLTRLLREKRFTRISFLNAHNANIAARNKEFAQALARFLVLSDGVGVDIASKILHGHAFPANLNGTDFIPAFLKTLEKPVSVALLGTTRANADAAATTLRRDAPQHRYTVINDGFFDAAREEQILLELREIRPDILLVGMGVPRQELWITRKVTAEHCTLPIGVGALLDFLSGAIPRAPMWMRRIRMEWLYRLCLEPGRLWQRYVIGNPVFLFRVIKERLRGRPSHD